MLLSFDAVASVPLMRWRRCSGKGTGPGAVFRASRENEKKRVKNSEKKRVKNSEKKRVKNSERKRVKNSMAITTEQKIASN